tara:strand:- start:154 stop:573 length:420 start_codon:yes stop_codon:yes gene_type:complete
MQSKKKTLKVPAKNNYGTGRRKSSIAKVWLFPGSGEVSVNDLAPEDYFNDKYSLNQLTLPLAVTSLTDKFDMKITVLGGGKSSQIDSSKLGISRALVELDPSLKPVLKENGLLTRDPRVKERKKYGLRGARKAPQYRKR